MIRYTERAELSVEAIAFYLGRAGGGSTAERFLESLDETVHTLARHPRIAPTLESANLFIRELRRWPIQGFANHYVFFRVISGGIEVVDVVHAARDLPNVLGDL